MGESGPLPQFESSAQLSYSNRASCAPSTRASSSQPATAASVSSSASAASSAVALEKGNGGSAAPPPPPVLPTSSAKGAPLPGKTVAKVVDVENFVPDAGDFDNFLDDDYSAGSNNLLNAAGKDLVESR